MNSEELKKEFGLLMPSEINGFKRPDESIPSNNDFFLEIPQLISKDPVLYSTMNLIFSVILSNDKLLKQWHDTLQNVVNEQDWRVVTDSIKGYMTPELKKKLDGIATGANNYVHPANHSATMITQDATHRFVTDTEKTTWNGKASTAVVSTTANGLAPKRDGNASHFLAGDGTWKTVSSVANATTASKLGTSTVGSASKPIYLNAGTATACNIDLSTLAPKSSPSFSGTPTAPTPNISDNSTKLATTAFVKSLFTANKQQNGWCKNEATGMIWQWGLATDIIASTSTQSQQKSINFNINFPTKCVMVIPFIINYTSQTSVGIITPQLGTLNLNNFGIYLDTYESVNIKVDIIWAAIGY